MNSEMVPVCIRDQDPAEGLCPGKKPAGQWGEPECLPDNFKAPPRRGTAVTQSST